MTGLSKTSACQFVSNVDLACQDMYREGVGQRCYVVPFSVIWEC